MREIRQWFRRRPLFAVGLAVAAVIATGVGARAAFDNLLLVGTLHAPQAEHLEQSALIALVQDNQSETAFEAAFEHGDELFETMFNAVDGVGANVGRNQRFSRVPRADLSGAGEWALHIPSRTTGPNAQSCRACHLEPTDDGGGPIAANVVRDPEHSGVLGRFIQRNTPHVFALGALQRLAEEMSDDLAAIRDATVLAACASSNGATRSGNLITKGVAFGTIRARQVSRGSVCPNANRRRFALDFSDVRGVDADLVVKPFQWKGSVAFLRDFSRGAGHNELGMQAVELVGDGVDGDFDGIVNELSVGDVTAFAIYLAAQPRPLATPELAALGLLPLTPAQQAAIANGAARFRQVGCDTCHKPALDLRDPLFSEPSQRPSFRDATFPAGQNPLARAVDPALPITFDLTRDLPDNRIEIDGEIVALGNHASNGRGGASIALYGDLKRHDMGTRLAEPINDEGIGAALFLTENLWGVGSTAPYMHDGRATTLTEAILAHGGEGTAARNAFTALPTTSQAEVIAFLDSLVLYKAAEE